MRGPIAAAVLAGLVLAGCGGTGSGVSSGAGVGTGPDGTAGVLVHPHRSAAEPSKATIAKLEATPAPKRIVKPLPGAIHKTVASVKARASNEPGANERQRSSGAGPANACRFVRAAEAQAILGRPVTAIQSPLAPACVYATRGHRLDVDVMVTTGKRFTPPRGKAAAQVRTRIGTRTAYCVKGISTFVPLGGTRVLRVDGACPLAARFAARALTRMG